MASLVSFWESEWVAGNKVLHLRIPFGTLWINILFSYKILSFFLLMVKSSFTPAFLLAVFLLPLTHTSTKSKSLLNLRPSDGYAIQSSIASKSLSHFSIIISFIIHIWPFLFISYLFCYSVVSLLYSFHLSMCLLKVIHYYFPKMKFCRPQQILSNS